MRRKYFFLPDRGVSDPKLPNKDGFGCVRLLLGAGLLLAALASSLLLDQVRASVRALLESQSSLGPDSHMLGVWANPPVVPRMKIYVYNVTNADDFLAGRDKKARVEELGPFTYAARQKKKVRHVMQFSTGVKDNSWNSARKTHGSLRSHWTHNILAA